MFTTTTWVCSTSTIVLHVLLSLVVSDQAESIGWTQLSTGVTKPAYFQQSGCRFSDPQYCYVFGGFDASGASNEMFLALGINLKLLKVDGPSPPPRGGGALVAFENGNAVLFGGTLADGTPTFDAHLMVMTTVVNSGDQYTWKQLTVNGTNNEVTGFGVSWDDSPSEFYTFFGVSGSGQPGISKAVVDMEALTITWSDVVPTPGLVLIPPSRFGATCQRSPATKKTLCVGGNDGSRDIVNDPVWSFDHVSLSWEILKIGVEMDPSIPFPARIGSACRVDAYEQDVIECYGGLETSTLDPVNDTRFLRVNMTTLDITFMISTTGKYLRGGGVLLSAGSGPVLLGGRSADGLDGVLVVYWSYRNNSVEYFPEVLPDLNKNPSPDPRADFCSIVVGDGAIVAFGRGATSAFNDVYYFDASTQMYYEIGVGDGLRPSPRYGASATASASTVYFFGGVLEDRQTLTNELWRLNVNIANRTATWELVSPTAPTAARAFHSSFFDNYRIFVVGGMLGNRHTFTGDMVVFEILDLTWRAVSVQPPLPPRAAHGFARSMDGSTFTIVGGRNEVYGAVRILGDIYQLTVPEYGTYTSSLVVIRATGPPWSPLGFLGNISDFTASALGNNVLICGGISQWTPTLQYVSMNEESRGCQLIHINSSNQLTITEVEMGGAWFIPVAAGAWAIGQYMYVFGGAVVALSYVGAVSMSEVSDITYSTTPYSTSPYSTSDAFRFTFPFCALGQEDDSDCLHCAGGYLNPVSTTTGGCTVVPAGYYATRPYLNATACPPGTYSNLTAATTVFTCQQCSAGTYASAEGSMMCLPCTNPSCPIGSTHPDQAETVIDTRLVSLQPEEFTVGTLPSWMWSLIGALAFCGILLAFIPTLVSARLREHRRVSYFPPDSLLKIRSVYELHKLPHFGINPEGLQLVLKELGVQHVSLKYAHTVLSENDQDGTGHLTFPDLQDVIIQFIDKGFLPPFTTEAYTVSKLEALLVNLNLKVFDAYDKEHSLGVNGDQMRYQTTRVGGMFRIAFFVFAISLILLLAGQFYYTNIIEVRSEVPSISRKFLVQTQLLSLQFTASGGVHSEGSCQNTGGLCVPGVRFTLNSEYADKYPSLKPSCSYNATAKSCTLQLSCAQCSFNFDSNVVVSVLFPPEVYASSITVGVSAYTGIMDSKSSVQMVLKSPLMSVFRGFPASSVFFTLTPTHYASVNNVIQQVPISGEGYHADFVYNVPGQSVEAIELSRYLSVPIVLQLAVSSGLLDITRLPQSSLLDFVAQLLGAIPGMGGVLLLVLGIYDRGFIARRFNKVRTEMESDMCDGNGVMRCSSDDVPPLSSSNTRDSSLSTALMTVNGYHCNEPEPDKMDSMHSIQEESEQCSHSN